MTALVFEKYLCKWVVLLFIIISGAVIFSWLLSLLIKRSWKLLPNIIKACVKEEDRLRNILVVCVLCSMFFLYWGWVINIYWLSYKKFHPVSLLSDLGILIVSIFLGWILTRINWVKLQRMLRPNLKLTSALILLLITFKICMVIDRRTTVPKGPNIILLVVDTLRADALGCYNKNSNNSPNIDNFAKNGVLFETAIAQGPMTINACPSILFSLYPYEHGYYNCSCLVPDKWSSAAEVLRDKGYRTFGISSNPHVTGRHGLAQGFEVFEEDLTWKDADCDELNQKFIEWLGNNKEKPFFAMLWYIDPHVAYNPPQEYIDKYIPDKQEQKYISDKVLSPVHKNLTTAEKQISKKLYAAEVNFFDTEFARLIDYFEQTGLMENSLIILTSDHGESFWEKKDILGRQICGHGNSLYGEQIDIPFILSVPNQKKGKVVSKKVQHVDIVPTILEYAKVNYIDSLPVRGESLKGLIDGEGLERKYLFSQLITNQNGPFYMESIQTDDFKLISTIQYRGTHFSPPHILRLGLGSNETEIKVTDEKMKSEFKNLNKKLIDWEGNLENAILISREIKYKNKEEENRLRKRLKSLGYLQ